MTSSDSRLSEAMAYKRELDGAAEACLCGRHYSNLETVGQRDSGLKLCCNKRGKLMQDWIVEGKGRSTDTPHCLIVNAQC